MSCAVGGVTPVASPAPDLPPKEPHALHHPCSHAPRTARGIAAAKTTEDHQARGHQDTRRGPASTSAPVTPAPANAGSIKLGYFPNVTHATGLVAAHAAYVGPSPAINSFTRSNGQAQRVVAGAADGGAFFIVKPQIGSAADLKGTTFKAGAQHAKDVGLLDKVALDGIDDLTILNKVLARSGKAPIS